MVFGVASPSDRLLDFGMQLLGLFIIPVGALAFDSWGWPNVGIPGALQRLSSFGCSTRLILELFNLFMQLAHGLVGRLVDVGLSLSCVAQPGGAAERGSACEACGSLTRASHPVAVLP